MGILSDSRRKSGPVQARQRDVEPPMHVYHRRESSTQTEEAARKQEQTGEVWGRARRGGNEPSVKAYRGPLPDGSRGVEFVTSVPPDIGCPPGRVDWTGPREGVTVEDEFAKIKVRVTKNTQV